MKNQMLGKPKVEKKLGGDVSVSKMLAIQVGRPELGLLEPTSKPGIVAVPAILVLGGRSGEDLWSSLARVLLNQCAPDSARHLVSNNKAETLGLNRYVQTNEHTNKCAAHIEIQTGQYNMFSLSSEHSVLANASSVQCVSWACVVQEMILRAWRILSHSHSVVLTLLL